MKLFNQQLSEAFLPAVVSFARARLPVQYNAMSREYVMKFYPVSSVTENSSRSFLFA